MSYKPISPEQVDYAALSPDQLVGLFAYVVHRLQTIRALAGGLTATELRRAHLRADARQALLNGLAHQNPRVRWWCLQVLDHVGDASCIPAIVARLDDPVARVRKMARHALECEHCKQSPDVVALGRRALAEYSAAQ